MARKPSPNANLKTIAQRMKVSAPTVWRALHNAPGIHPNTRARILEAATAVGYTAHLNGNNLLGRKSHSILALAHSIAPLTDQRFITGMSRASLRLNLNILSHHVSAHESFIDPASQPNALKLGDVEGIVLIHRWPPQDAHYIATHWPTVSIVHKYQESPIDHIGIDDQMGMAALVSHLLEGGHRKIGFFGFCREMSWSCSRLAAFFLALTQRGLPYEPENVVPITLQEATSHSPFARAAWSDTILKRLRQKTDAWICSSAGTAATLCRFLLAEKIRLPEDVSLAGFHRSLSDVSNDLPVITSTEVSDEELGAAALRRLLHRMEYSSESPRSILMPALLARGETTRSRLL